MERVGFLQIFNEVEWVDHAIDQAKKLCDRLIICEGSQFTNFPNIPERSDDGTIEHIHEAINAYDGFIELVDTVRTSSNYRNNQCVNFNRALKTCKPGDLFFPLDADEFYTDQFIEDLKPIVANHHDMINRLTVNGKMFAFGFPWEIRFSKGDVRKDVFYRVEKGLHFTPTHNPKGWTSVMDRDLVFSGVYFHHYTWVKPAERMRWRFQTSGMYPNMPKWFNDNWSQLDATDGNVFNTYKPGITAELKFYRGNHPSLLDSHVWRHVSDVRRVL